jgi:hypothetical protein
LNYPELGFAVLNDNLSQDPKVGKRTALGSHSRLPDTLKISSVRSEVLVGDGRPLVHGPPPPSRAPPFRASI